VEYKIHYEIIMPRTAIIDRNEARKLGEALDPAEPASHVHYYGQPVNRMRKVASA